MRVVTTILRYSFEPITLQIEALEQVEENLAQARARNEPLERQLRDAITKNSTLQQQQQAMRADLRRVLSERSSLHSLREILENKSGNLQSKKVVSGAKVVIPSTYGTQSLTATRSRTSRRSRH